MINETVLLVAGEVKFMTSVRDRRITRITFFPGDNDER